jgi:hypothetical protein
MKPVCSTCRFAEWRKTANGRRHPDGSGKCGYLFPTTPLPVCIQSSYEYRGCNTIADALKRGGRWITWQSELECGTWEAK